MRSSGPTWAAAVTVLIAISAFVLGLVGYLQLGDIPVTSAIYDTLGLFTLSFTLPPGVTESEIPVTLQVARFLAPAVTAFAVAGVIARVFRDQLDLLKARRAKGHAVVSGLGRVGVITAGRLRDGGYGVVAIERDASSPGITEARAQGIPVVVGDASAPETLARAGIQRAGRLVWTAGEWVQGQSVVDGLEQEIENAKDRRGKEQAWESVPTCLVRVRDLALCTALRRQVLAHDWRETGAGPDVDFFNEAENAAQQLLWEVTRGYALADDDHDVELWVLGSGQLAEALVVQAARNWWGSRSRPTLTVRLFGEDADTDANRIMATWPEIADACRLEPHPGPPEAAAIGPTNGWTGADPDAVFVLVDGEDRAVQIGLRLVDETSVASVVVAAAGPYRSQLVHDRLVLFDPGSFGLGSAVLLLDTYELLGRMIHEHYDLLHSLRADGTLEADRDPMGTRREWPELAQLWRSSNRDAARFVVPNLREAGLQIRRRSARTNATSGVWDPKADPQRVDEMARREHERWKKFMEAHDYRLGPGRSDTAPLLTRPGLVEWSDAIEFEADREYTRTQVREYPRLLAQLGYQVRLP